MKGVKLITEDFTGVLYSLSFSRSGWVMQLMMDVIGWEYDKMGS